MPIPGIVDAIHSPGAAASIFGFESFHAARFAAVFARLLVAFALSATVSYRPWRALIPRRRRPLPPTLENAQAQTLIAVAGALMVSVIGDNMARAFGLVGLGAFIRFRSGIKDPRDAAVMFVMIGIGMACGLGNVPIALVAAAFCGVVLALFDATAKARLRKIRVAIEMDQPRADFPAVRSILPGARVLDIPSSNADGGKVVLEVAVGENDDASSILDRFEEQELQGIRRVTLEEPRPNGG
jgi:uncharacterized membrane protein YhiD involved in acid resistance